MRFNRQERVDRVAGAESSMPQGGRVKGGQSGSPKAAFAQPPSEDQNVPFPLPFFPGASKTLPQAPGPPHDPTHPTRPTQSLFTASSDPALLSPRATIAFF